MKKHLILVAILGFITSGCLDKSKSYTNEVCVADIKIMGGLEPNCKEGQVFSFRPQRWGNEQMPILVSTYFCDFNYPIVQNNGGVACIYKRKYNAEEEKNIDNNSSK